MAKRTYKVHGIRSRYGFCDAQGDIVCIVHQVGTWCCPHCSEHHCPICRTECAGCGADIKDKLAS